MKKTLLFITILCIQFLCGQFVLNFDNNIYYKAKVELEDGSVKEGYVLSFDDKTAFYYNTSEYQLLFGSPENNNGLIEEQNKMFYDMMFNEEIIDFINLCN